MDWNHTAEDVNMIMSAVHTMHAIIREPHQSLIPNDYDAVCGVNVPVS